MSEILSIRGGDGDEGGISFTLPSFPLSMNRIYEVNYNLRKFGLTAEALLWKTRHTPFVKPCKWAPETLIELELIYESPDWFYKNGNLRRLDVHNLEKLVIDTITGKWGMDDKNVVRKVTEKRWGPREQVRIMVRRAPDDWLKETSV